MDFYTPRKLMFKAWNKESKLLMRLNNIECVKGELFKKDHILLQFTGFYDKQQDEIYEMDVLLIGSDKFVIVWDAERGWIFAKFENKSITESLSKEKISKAVRLWSYFESDKRVN